MKKIKPNLTGILLIVFGVIIIVFAIMFLAAEPTKNEQPLIINEINI